MDNKNNKNMDSNKKSDRVEFANELDMDMDKKNNNNNNNKTNKK